MATIAMGSIRGFFAATEKDILGGIGYINNRAFACAGMGAIAEGLVAGKAAGTPRVNLTFFHFHQVIGLFRWAFFEFGHGFSFFLVWIRVFKPSCLQVLSQILE